MFELHHDGELRDWLVTEANHKDFAEAVERVIDEELRRVTTETYLVGGPHSSKLRSRIGRHLVRYVAGLNHYMRLGSNYDPSQSIKIAEVDKLDKSLNQSMSLNQEPPFLDRAATTRRSVSLLYRYQGRGTPSPCGSC